MGKAYYRACTAYNAADRADELNPVPSVHVATAMLRNYAFAAVVEESRAGGIDWPAVFRDAMNSGDRAEMLNACRLNDRNGEFEDLDGETLYQILENWIILSKA